MRRVLAVLGALAMVTMAVIVRQGIDDDGIDRPRARTGATVLVCATDLAEACRALGDGIEVRVEEAATTAAAIGDDTLAADVDAWITTSAWVEVVDARAPGAARDTEAVASSPAVVAVAPGRFDAITDLCRGQDVWACLGDAAGRDWADLGNGTNGSWRELKVGITDPSSATGLGVLASAAAGFFGTTEFAVNDPGYPDFEGWLATLAEPSAGGDADPALTLATRPGTYSAAGAVAAGAAPLAARGVQVVEPEVAVTVTVVGVSLTARPLPDLAPIRAYLDDRGWSGAVPDALAPTMRPGVMAALHTLWRAVTT